MIHRSLNKSHVAQTYYLLQSGTRLSPQQAVKKFIQDKNINPTFIGLVIDTILIEQKQILKHYLKKSNGK